MNNLLLQVLDHKRLFFLHALAFSLMGRMFKTDIELQLAYSSFFLIAMYVFMKIIGNNCNFAQHPLFKCYGI